MTPAWWSRVVDEGTKGRDVAVVQRMLGLEPSGVADGELVAVVRGFQKGAGLPVSGVVDELTAVTLGEREGHGLLPSWWTEPVGPDDFRYGLALRLLGVADVDAVKRFQGNRRLPATGVIDEETARLLAALEVE